MRSFSFLRGQIYADQFFVIASKYVLIGKRRVRPANAAALWELVFRWFEQLCPADLFITPGRKLRDDQFPSFVEEKVTIAILDEMDRAPARARNSGGVFPYAMTIAGFEAA